SLGRARRRRVRGRRQDLQGAHRRSVRRDDLAALGARDGGRRLHRTRPARGRRRGRVQRDPEESDVSLGARAPLRPHHEDPRRQGPDPDAHAARLFGWTLATWRHAVTPMSDPYPPAAEMQAFYSNALPWVGRVRDFQVATPDGGAEFDWNWKAMYNRALYTVRPFMYFHFAAGTRRVVVDGVEPMDTPADSIQFFMFDELYRKTIHRDAETLGMEICMPVWKHRAFIDAHGYDHARITTLLLVTTEETRLEDLLARKVATGDIGATANTILALGSERVGNRLARMLCVVKHRGSPMSDEIVEFRITEGGV